MRNIYVETRNNLNYQLTELEEYLAIIRGKIQARFGNGREINTLLSLNECEAKERGAGNVYGGLKELEAETRRIYPNREIFLNAPIHIGKYEGEEFRVSSGRIFKDGEFTLQQLLKSIKTLKEQIKALDAIITILQHPRQSPDKKQHDPEPPSAGAGRPGLK